MLPDPSVNAKVSARATCAASRTMAHRAAQRIRLIVVSGGTSIVEPDIPGGAASVDIGYDAVSGAVNGFAKERICIFVSDIPGRARLG
jgi:hypothetical protein